MRFLTAFLMLSSVTADVHTIAPDTPGGLARAIKEAAAGDTLILSAGRYSGPNSRNLTLEKRLTIQSATGETADTTIVDCEHVEQCLVLSAEATGTRLERVGLFNGGLIEQTPAAPRSDKGMGHLGLGNRTNPNPRFNRPDSRIIRKQAIQNVTSASPNVELSGVEVAKLLSQLSRREATRALSYWLQSWKTMDIISCLPLELIAHPNLWTRVVKGRARPPREWQNKTEDQNIAVADSEWARVAKSKEEKPHEWPDKLEQNNIPVVDAIRTENSCLPPPEPTSCGCTGSTTLTEACGSLTDASLGDYARNSACFWTIDPPNARYLNISFWMLDIEAHPSCDYDALSMSETDENGYRKELGSFCGDLRTLYCGGGECLSLQLTELIVTPPFTIQLTSDESSQGDGFAFSWQIADSKSEEPPKVVTTERFTEFGGCLLVKGATVTLDRVHIRGGVADFGGGLALVDASASIMNCLFVANLARSGGGGVFVKQSAVSVQQTRLLENQARSSQTVLCVATAGAGLYASSSTVYFRTSEIKGNILESYCLEFGQGGGVFVQDSEILLEGTRVDNNTVIGFGDDHASSGAGLASRRSNVSISFSSLSWNTLHGAGIEGSGAGIYGREGRLVVSASTVTHNSVFGSRDSDVAIVTGGGVSSLFSTTTLIWTNVSNNYIIGHSAVGGGLFFESGIATLSSCHVHDNSAIAQYSMKGAGLAYTHTEFPGVFANFSISSSSVSSNVGQGAKVTGGGMYVNCDIISKAVCSVFSSQVRNNSLSGSNFCQGGGVATWSGRVHVTSSAIISNSIRCLRDTAVGGGLFAGFCRQPGAVCTWVSVFSSRIASNSVSGIRRTITLVAYGGGLMVASGNATVFRSNISNNLVSGVSYWTRSCGAGIFLSIGRLEMSSSEVSRNAALCTTNRHCLSGGGGIAIGDTNKPEIFDPSPGGQAFLVSSRVLLNSIEVNVVRQIGNEDHITTVGGGILFHGDTLVLLSSDVSSNVAQSRRASGGGIGCYDTLALSLSRITNNSVLGEDVLGGGVWLSGRLTMSSSHISGNSLLASAPGSVLKGGGVYSGDSFMHLVSSHVSSNMLRALGEGLSYRVYGGGIFSSRPRALSVLYCHVENNALHSSGFGFGAGFYITSPSNAVVVNQTVFSSNKVIARIGQAGALFFHLTDESGNSTVLVKGSLIDENSVFGSEVSGGAAHIDGDTVLDPTVVFSMIRARNNSCHGTSNSVGGAFSLMQGGALIVRESSLVGNTAASGGGMYFSGSVSVLLVGSSLRGNRATGVGGAILANGGVSLLLRDMVLEHNHALLADNVFGYGTGFTVRCDNARMVSSGVMSTFAQGQRDGIVLSQKGVLSSTHIGWVFEMASTSRSEIVRFSACPVGSYLLGKSTSANRLECLACPSRGAYCSGGADVYATRSHWGWVSETFELTMAPCPEGYCCAEQRCFPYNFCRHDRTGFLCGVCADGYSEVLGGSGCRRDAECDSLPWLLPPTIILTGLIIALLLYFRKRKIMAPGTQRSDTGERKIIVFFFQMLPLVVTTELLEAQPALLQILLSVLNLTIASGGTRGWCPLPGFSFTAKIGTRFILPGLLVVWLGIFCAGQAVHVAVHRHNIPGMRLFGAHIATFFIVVGLAYSSLVHGTFQLVACVELPGRTVLFRSAVVECFEPWQMVVLGTLVPVLTAWPLVLAFIVHKSQKRTESSEFDKAVLGVIADCYANRRAALQWEAILMLERLVISVAAVFIMQPLWRAWALVALLVPMLVLHLLVRPFSTAKSNAFMSACYGSLLALGSWEIGQAVYRDYGLPIPSGIRVQFAFIVSVLTLAPFCVACCFMIRSYSALLHPILRKFKLKSTKPQSLSLELSEDTLPTSWDPSFEQTNDTVLC